MLIWLSYFLFIITLDAGLKEFALAALPIAGNTPANGEVRGMTSIDLITHPRVVGRGILGMRVQTNNKAAHHVEEDFLQYEHTAIIGEIRLGTPPQQFNVKFNTLSKDFWLVDTICELPICARTPLTHGHYARNRFNKTASTTFEEASPPFLYSKAPYGEGTLGRDTFSLGSVGKPYLPVKSMRVGLMTELFVSALGTEMWMKQIDGMFGLRPTRRAGGKKDPYMHYPLDSLLSGLAEKSFTIWMDPLPNWNSTAAGRITFGGVDTANCVSAWKSALPVINGSHSWAVRLPRARFDGDLPMLAGASKSAGDDSAAAADPPSAEFTLYHAILMPSDIYDAIMKRLSAKFHLVKKTPYGFPAIEDCRQEQLPSLDLSWDHDSKGQPIWYRIPANAYAIKREDSMCVMVFTRGEEGGSHWELGAPFYRAYCVKHDLDGMSVSLGERKGDRFLFMRR